MASLFVGLEAYEHDVARRLAEEEARLAARNLMQAGGPSLHVGIVPREFYERGRAMFSPCGNRPKSISLFHDRRGAVFRGCDGGYEATEIDFHEKVISRTFVGHDWFVHAHVAHAFTADASGRVRLHEFKSDLTTFLADLDEFLTEEGLRGPFCVALAVRNLRRSEKVAWVFPAAEAVELPRGALVERVAAPTLIDTFHGQLLGASRYG
ncbi:MAG: hypothetical protein GC203_00005 [Phenylobacterium sp.]|uniref:hypothetical protein n=1 Tax=Phenylobacterium sp. TaxID=1871053 RepID=UPI0025E5E635|nr:hypothetical protein [Phenylobacterium sp.]MBI1196226.1 hypothetical protein [Phenylobacterium sp.]